MYAYFVKTLTKFWKQIAKLKPELIEKSKKYIYIYLFLSIFVYL